MAQEDRQTTGGRDPNLWVDLYGDVLYRYALQRVRDAAVAEDLVQETFLAALSAKSEFQGQSAIQTWLIGILRHKMVDHFRRKSSREIATAEDSIQALLDTFFTKRGKWHGGPRKLPADPADAGLRQEFWDALQYCLDQLAPILSRVFILREMEQMSSEEVCKVLEISPSNLWVRMYRARMLLRDCMDQKGMSPEQNG